MIVPAAVGVTVDTQGGVVAVSGTTDTTVDSNGGPMRITQATGPLTVRSGGGLKILNEVGGPLRADTSGGMLTAREITATTAIFTTGGGPELIGIVTDPAARLSLTITSGGGPLQVEPAASGGAP